MSEKETKKETKYKREILLKCKEFAGYQPDFLAVILKNPEYTMAEARSAVKKFFGGGK